MISSAPRHHADPRARGFTLVELLIVILVIGILASILIVAAGSVLRGAKNAAALRQLQAIGQGIEQFRSDFGYIPPLMGRDQTGGTVTDPLSSQNPNLQLRRIRQMRFSSEYTLAMYLIGAGNIDGDPAGRATGANTDEDDGHAGPGFLDPGIDRSWGGAATRKDQHADRSGRVFGPYLDMAALGDSLRLDFDADNAASSTEAHTPITGLFYILDPWDQPIRYYTGWPTIDPVTRITSVARVPVELRTRDAIEAQIAAGGQPGNADLRLDRAVLNSQYILLSAGKPTRFARYDDSIPVPLFGEFGPNDTLIQDDNALRDGSFDPTALSNEARDFLLERLDSNVRSTP